MRLQGWDYENARGEWQRADETPEAIAKRGSVEAAARAEGWFPTRQAHIMFQESTGVCRALKSGETYTDGTDSLMSRPLRHAESWADACSMDNLYVPTFHLSVASKIGVWIDRRKLRACNLTYYTREHAEAAAAKLKASVFGIDRIDVVSSEKAPA